MQGVIEIDGSLFEGGGQMFRSSVALSYILGLGFTMHSIRKNRPNPGINNQLQSVLASLTDKPPKLGDTDLFFYPKEFAPKTVKARSASSCTLVMQCLVPASAALHYEDEITIEGGTDVNKSPPTESLQLGLFPLFKKMGVTVEITDTKRGYYPVGKGSHTIKVTSEPMIGPISIIKFSPPTHCYVTYYNKSSNLPNSHTEFKKELKRTLSQALGNHKFEFVFRAQKVFNTRGDEYGIGCLLVGPDCVWDAGTVGEPIAEAQILGRLEKLVDSKPCLDEHHQDQLLIFAALANGQSKFNIGPAMSLHTQSLIYVIQKFLPQCSINHQNSILTVKGIGYKSL